MRLPAAVVRRTLRAVSAPLVRPGVPYPVLRAGMAGGAGLLARGLPYTSSSLGGVPCEVVGSGSSRTLLYLHGGAYVMGSPATHRPLVSRLASRLDATAYVLDYRLAPEHVFPAALDDGDAAYAALLAGPAGAGEVVVAGDSCGGGLALALAQRLRDSGAPAPAALGLICPWLDLTATRPPAPREPLLRTAALDRWAAAYAGPGGSLSDPGLSPLLGALDGLPPIVVQSGDDDLLLPDALRLAEAVPDAVHLRGPGAWHVTHAFAGVLRQADQAIDQLAAALVDVAAR